MTQTIDELVQRFKSIPFTAVSGGPSASPQFKARAAEVMTRFLELFPWLTNYPDYLYFLERYGGAVAGHALPDDAEYPTEPFHYVSLHGYTELNSVFAETAVSKSVDSNGLFAISEIGQSYRSRSKDEPWLKGRIYSLISLEATGRRPRGVYAQWMIDDEKGEYSDKPGEFVAGSFSEWLARFIDNGCRMWLPSGDLEGGLPIAHSDLGGLKVAGGANVDQPKGSNEA